MAAINGLTGVFDSTDIPDHPIVGSRLIYGEGTPAADWQQWDKLATLPALTVSQHFPRDKRVCIFAPHPDDEILGCAGLMQQLVQQGNRVMLVSVTNGTQSHPNSSLYPSELLNTLRPQETQNALRALAIAEDVEHLALDIPDGQVLENQQQLATMLASFLTKDDILVPTFRLDGHPDHETVGNVVLTYAKTHGLACYQVLIWALHWARPNDERIDWSKVLRLDLTDAEQKQKRQAIPCFDSQITPDTSTGQAAVLPDYAIVRATQGWELYIDEIA